MDMNVRLMTPDEAAEFLGVTRRRVFQLPIKQRRLGERTIRFHLTDIYEYLGMDDPNSWYEDESPGVDNEVDGDALPLGV